VEWQSAEADELTEQEVGAQAMLAGLPLVSATTPSRDAGARKALWTLRKNLYPAVAGARPSGTTALLEDIAVPPADLATTCDGLATLFAAHSVRP
jgi:D-lactate dehydrogenase